MLPTEVRVGWVFRYAYLWDWQHREGREEGDKDRPCLVLAIVTTDEQGAPTVRVLPITHTPVDSADAIEIRAPVKAHLRLDHQRSWIVLTESNRLSGLDPTCVPSTRRATMDRCRRRCWGGEAPLRSNRPR